MRNFSLILSSEKNFSTTHTSNFTISYTCLNCFTKMFPMQNIKRSPFLVGSSPGQRARHKHINAITIQSSRRTVALNINGRRARAGRPTFVFMRKFPGRLVNFTWDYMDVSRFGCEVCTCACTDARTRDYVTNTANDLLSRIHRTTV